MPKRAIITGVTGQDGSYLAELLAGKGYRVVGTSRCPPATHSGGVELRALDPVDFEGMRALVGELAPDELYHLAGQSSVGFSFEEPRKSFESIVTSSLNVLDAVRTGSPATRVFIAGSGEVFGECDAGPADETTPFRPRSPYAAAKAAAAELTRVYRSAYGLFACVGFLFNHESPRRPERFVTRRITAGARAIALGTATDLTLGDLRVVRDWGWAPEYVEAMWRMLAQDVPDDFVLATGEAHSLEEFVERAFAEHGLAARDHVRIDPARYRPSEVRVLRGNPLRAEEQLGFSPGVHFAEVVSRLVAAENDRAKPSA